MKKRAPLLLLTGLMIALPFFMGCKSSRVQTLESQSSRTPETALLDFNNPSPTEPIDQVPFKPALGEIQSHAQPVNPVVNWFTPERVRKYEGSYSRDELMNGSGQPPSIALKSQWLLRNDALPQLGVRLRKNAETGEYELGGTQLYLPQKGMGISYESDYKGEGSLFFIHLERKF